MQELTPSLAEQLGIRVNDGVMVARVAPGTPAAEAGLRARDVILEANRQPVSSIKSFREQIDDAKGEFVLLLVSRDGQTLFRSLKLSK